MTLTVESKDGRIEVFHDSGFSKNVAFICVPDCDRELLIRVVPVKHSDIDSITETLQLYKERMTEVLGEGALM